MSFKNFSTHSKVSKIAYDTRVLAQPKFNNKNGKANVANVSELKYLVSYRLLAEYSVVTLSAVTLSVTRSPGRTFAFMVLAASDSNSAVMS